MDRKRRAGAISAGHRTGRADADERMGIFSEIFSWWGGNTWSNRLYTGVAGQAGRHRRHGNRYYVQSKGIGPLGVPRRWVIYKQPRRGLADPARMARLDALSRSTRRRPRRTTRRGPGRSRIA